MGRWKTFTTFLKHYLFSSRTVDAGKVLDGETALVEGLMSVEDRELERDQVSKILRNSGETIYSGRGRPRKSDARK